MVARYNQESSAGRWSWLATHGFVQLFDGVTGSVSETAGTPLASGSRVALSKPLPVDVESSKDKEHHATDVESKSMEWGTLLADVYPLVKIMEVQVCHTLPLCFFM